MSYRINGRCDGCSACERQCPTRAIAGVFKETYTIDPSGCIDCGVCGHICPIDAVEDQFGRIAERIPRVLRLRPVVDHNACNGCGMCVDFCPFGCLRVIGGPNTGISVLTKPLACVSCSECSDICLKRAIAMKPISLIEIDPDQAQERVWQHLGKVESCG